MVAPIFEQLSNKYSKEAVFAKLDVDKVREAAQSAGVKSLPSFGFFHDGALLELQVGGDPAALEAKIKTLSAKHSSYAFKGTGHSMLGSSSSSSGAGAGAGAVPHTKAIGANAPSAPSGGRRNPWADPHSSVSMNLAKAAKGEGAAAAPAAAKPAAKPAPVAAAKPAAAPAPAPVAAVKPAAPAPAAAAPKPAAAAAAPASSGAASERPNPWATKEVKGASAPAAAPAHAPAAAAPAAAAVTPAAAPAASSSSAPAAAPAAAAAAAAPADSSSSSSSAAASAPAGPAANDPALVKNLNSGFLSALTDMGFPRLRCEKALILTGNKSVDKALEWLMAHESDADIDEPLQVVGSTAKAPPGVNLDDMDEDERAIYEQMHAKRMAEKGISLAGGANEAPQKVSTLNMTSEVRTQQTHIR